MAVKRGRPPLSPGESSTPVSLKMPTSLYDRAYARATRDRMTVAELLRRALTRVLLDESGGTLHL